MVEHLRREVYPGWCTLGERCTQGGISSYMPPGYGRVYQQWCICLPVYPGYTYRTDVTCADTPPGTPMGLRRGPGLTSEINYGDMRRREAHSPPTVKGEI